MARPDRQTILLIVVDSARADHFGCYGYGRGTTPAIDALAREGLVYEQMISSAPWTLPSHGSLFTGLYPREHGADHPSLRARTGVMTLDQHLQRHGFETVYVSNNPVVSRRTGIIGEGSRVLMREDFNREARRRGAGRWLRRVRKLTGQSDRGSGATNRAVRKILREGGDRLFIFINYMECHWHYVSPYAFQQRFVRQRFSPLAAARFRLRTRRRYSWENVHASDPAEAQLVTDLYDSALACVDDRVGDLMDALAETRRRDEATVIVMADHGENLGDHGRSGHGMTLHQTLLRVPFVTRIPGRAPARVSGLAQSTDLFAGLCRLAALPVPDHLRDRPFADDVFAPGRDGAGREYAFAEYNRLGASFLTRRQRTGLVPPPSAETVRDARYSLILEPSTGQEWLHDLRADPAEGENRVQALRAERDRLVAVLEQWRAACPPVGEATAYTPEEERALERRLADLGYI